MSQQLPRICLHAGWGQYPGEEGPTPPPAEMVPVQGEGVDGVECPRCKSREVLIVGQRNIERYRTEMIRGYEKR